MRARNVDGVLRFYDDDGVEITEEQALGELPAEEVNKARLLGKMKAAVEYNKTALPNIDTASNAQLRNHIEALTKQLNGVLKVLARDLADTEGTE